MAEMELETKPMNEMGKRITQDFAPISFAKERIKRGSSVVYPLEDVHGELITHTFTDADTENGIDHIIKDHIPVAVIPVVASQSPQTAGELFAGTTAWTRKKVYLSCSVRNVTWTFLVL